LRISLKIGVFPQPASGGAGVGLGTVLLILLIAYMLGLFR